MGRRAITLSVGWLAAIGAAGVAAVFATRTAGDAFSEVTRARDGAPVVAQDAVAAETATPSAPGGDVAAETDTAEKTGVRGSASSDPVREVEAVAQVDFPGLILLRSAPSDAPPEVGTIVFRNADPSEPPLRIELPVKNGRFRGRGPIRAVVAVEQLVLSGRELAFEPRTWKLASRWIEVEASWVPPTIVHVVDSESGAELKRVLVRAATHERFAPGSGGVALRDFSVRSAGPDGGSDSPLLLVAAPTTVVLHIAGYGDETVEIGGDEREKRVEMKRPASIHVVAFPWPGEPIRTWRGDSLQFGSVAIARVDAANLPSAESARPPGPRASLDAKRAAATAWRARAEQASKSALQRTARLDEHGEARFEDLPGGTYLVWLCLDERSNWSFGRRLTVVGETPVSELVVQERSQPLIDVTTRPGTRTEVTLPNRSFAEPSATIRVRAIDALDGLPVALAADEVFVIPCELAGSIRSDWDRRSGSAVPVRDSGDGTLGYETTSGAYVLSVDPRHHLRSRPWNDWIDVKPGENEFTVALPRAQGIVVEIVAPREVVRHRAAWFERVLPELRHGDETLRPDAFWPTSELENWPDPDPSPQRLVHRYPSLDTGRFELVIPDGEGYDRSGVLPLEVRENEVTTIELTLTPPAESDAER